MNNEKNTSILIMPDGLQVLFSYNVPVAGFKPYLGWFYTEMYYGAETAKHINKYLEHTDDAMNMPQEYLNNLVNQQMVINKEIQ